MATMVHLRFLFLCFIMAVFLVGQGIAQETEQMNPEMMEAYMKMMAVTENHSYLENFVGGWEVKTTGWMQPGAEPFVEQGKAKGELILGGRFLKMDFKGTMFGQPFEGLQIVGYDNLQQKYVTFWIDSSSTAFYLTKGIRDKEKNIITDEGLWPDPMTGENIGVRMTTTLISQDEFVFEMYMLLPSGDEFKSVENRMIRKK